MVAVKTNENIARFHVSVQDVKTVHVGKAFENFSKKVTEVSQS